MMKKMDTSTRLLKTGPMSSSSESMARYKSLGDGEEQGNKGDYFRIVCPRRGEFDGAMNVSDSKEDAYFGQPSKVETVKRASIP